MIVVGIVLGIIMLLVLWVLLVPVNFEINTDRGVFQIRQSGTITVSWHPYEKKPVRLRIFGVPVDVKRTKKRRSRETKIPTKARPQKVKSWLAWRRLFQRIRGSIRCRRFICRFDFGDVIMNAQVAPLAYYLSRGPVVLQVNFEKRYLLDLWIQIRMHMVLLAFIRFYSSK